MNALAAKPLLAQASAAGGVPDAAPLGVGAALRQLPLFAKLTDQALAVFERAAQYRRYPKGRIIFLQGDEPTLFYIVTGGWIKLFRTMPEGDEVIVDMLTTGHMFGESAIFEQDAHMCSAAVVEEVGLLSLPARLLKQEVVSNAQLALNMLAAMSRHHRHHTSALAFNTMLSAPQRIGCFLLRLCPMGANGQQVVFTLPYDKSLIADTLGMKSATFSRALNLLRRQTGLKVEGAQVTITELERLARFVYGPQGTGYISPDM